MAVRTYISPGAAQINPTGGANTKVTSYVSPGAVQPQYTAASAAVGWGYDADAVFPARFQRRLTAFADDVLWPRTVVATPAQFGWEPAPILPVRRRSRNPQFDEAPPQPPAVAATPAQFGWDQLPILSLFRRARNAITDEVIGLPTAVATPSAQGFAWEPQFPERRKYQPFAPDSPPEVWPVTVVSTPTQVGWDTPIFHLIRRRPRPSFTGDPVPMIVPKFVPNTKKFVYGLVSRVGRFLGR